MVVIFGVQESDLLVPMPYQADCCERLVTAVSAVPDAELMNSSHVFMMLVLAIRSRVDWVAFDKALQEAGGVTPPAYLDPPTAQVNLRVDSRLYPFAQDE